MTQQLGLDLFVAEAIEQAKAEQSIETECKKFMGLKGEYGYSFPLTLTVADYHAIWDDGYHRACDWEKRYADLIAPLQEKLSKLPPRDRLGRAPINAEIARLTRISVLGHALHDQAYEASQAVLDEAVTAQWETRAEKDSETIETAHEDFWHSVTERYAIEETWLWTLQDAADIAIFYALALEQGSGAAEDSPEFCAAYLKARARSEFSLTRSESFSEHTTKEPCLITRIRNKKASPASDKKAAGAACTAPA